MAIEDDDKPKRKITHDIGQDLSLLSVDELGESRNTAVLDASAPTSEPVRERL